jgi:hypothetical protein
MTNEQLAQFKELLHVYLTKALEHDRAEQVATEPISRMPVVDAYHDVIQYVRLLRSPE